MKDAFYDFEALVAPDYDWGDWLDSTGKPLEVPTSGFYSLESELAVEMASNSLAESKEKLGPILVPVVQQDSVIRRYRPMDRQNAALFQVFADVNYRSRDEVRRFALQYGLLGTEVATQTVRYRHADGSSRVHYVAGESFLNWALEICLMRDAIRLSDSQRSEEDERRLSWLFDRNLQHVQGRLRMMPSGDRRLVIAPLKLISAMWLQLALAISGEKRYVACKFCRRTLELSTDEMGFRSHRLFCSGACKTKDYRKRKRSAVSLGRSGLDAASIATRIDTDIATVKAWLGSGLQRQASRTGRA